MYLLCFLMVGERLNSFDKNPVQVALWMFSSHEESRVSLRFGSFKQQKFIITQFLWLGPQTGSSGSGFLNKATVAMLEGLQLCHGSTGTGSSRLQSV